MTVFRNPISYSIYALFGILVLLSFGESPLLVLQHLIVPYTVDVSRGVGDEGAKVFRAITFLVQALIAVSILLVVNAKSGGQRIGISIVGVILAIMYVLIVVLGYILPRFH